MQRAHPVLRVGFVATGPLTTPILAMAMEQIPDTRLEMRRLGFTEGVDSLLAGDVDVAFLPEPLPSMPKRLSKIPISTEPRVLVVPASASVGSAPVGADRRDRR